MEVYLLESMAWYLYIDYGVTLHGSGTSQKLCVNTRDLRVLFKVLRNETRKPSKNNEKVSKYLYLAELQVKTPSLELLLVQNWVFLSVTCAHLLWDTSASSSILFLVGI